MHRCSPMQLEGLYRQMARARAFEAAVEALWRRGLISGEMHLGTGEEAVAAGVITHLVDGDGLALTHRASPALVVRGVPLVPILRELLGRSDGLGGGHGGHMHLFAREQLAATSGIVGASLPMGAGFALAAKRLRRHAIGLAMTGDGAMNQGAALETLNLAVAWELPLVVVCVDNGWAITTRAGTVTGGDLGERARAFGWDVRTVDGTDVAAVHEAAGGLIGRVRKGRGPGFLLAACPRLDGHFLGDPMLEQARHLTGGAARKTLGRVVSAAVRPSGSGPLARAGGVLSMMGTLSRARRGTARGDRDDPLRVARRAFRGRDDERARIDDEVEREIAQAVAEAVGEEARDG